MSTENQPPVASPPAVAEDRTTAVLAYLTIIGFIVALVIHSSKKTALGAYHLRQVLGLIVSGIVLAIVGIVVMFIPFVGLLAMLACWLGFLVMWLMGLVAAASGHQKPMPILGAKYQQWFSGAFN